MGFRIGGLLIAAALCILVILEVSDDSSKDSPHNQLAVFKTHPQHMDVGTEVVLCARVAKPKLLKEVKFHPSAGEMSLWSRQEESSSALSGGIEPPKLRPGCKFYRAPKTVRKNGEIVFVSLVLNGKVEEKLPIPVFRNEL